MVSALAQRRMLGVIFEKGLIMTESPKFTKVMLHPHMVMRESQSERERQREREGNRACTRACSACTRSEANLLGNLPCNFHGGK